MGAVLLIKANLLAEEVKEELLMWYKKNCRADQVGDEN